jgi:branched-chain amino acid aminotransferase
MGITNMTAISFDNLDGSIWYDGEMVPWREAKLHVLSHALHYASSVFEGERVYSGEIFESRAHTERLRKSAQVLDFEIPWSVEEIEAAKKATVAASGLSNAYIRPVAWRGSEMMGVSAQDNTIHMAIAVWDWPSYFDAEAKMAGINLQMAPYRRPAPDMAPTDAKAAGLYMICTLSKHKAEKEGYHDALMLDYRGQIAEATGANIFFLMDDDRIHTPTPDCFLDGITRRTVIGMAKARGYEVVERAMMPEEMANARECFLTGTAAEVTPVGRIADYTFTPGEVCKTLMEDYTSKVNSPAAPAAAE